MKSLSGRLFPGRPVGDAVLVCALAASLLFSQISISLTQGFLAVALAVWIILLIGKKRRFDVPVFFRALAVYAALSLASSAFSVNPRMSFWDSRELLLILAVPVVLAAVRRKEDLGLILGAALASASVNGLYSIYVRLTTDVERVEGFMSHYMTQAGITALFISFALGWLLGGFGGRPKSPAGAPQSRRLLPERAVWGMALLLAAAANLLTYTRGAWIGIGAALVAAVFFWKPKALVVLPILAVLGFFVAPKSIRDRAASIFTMRDSSNIARVQYFKTGMKIIADYPVFGTGPDTVDMVFQDEKYGLGVYAKHNVHLHSNVIQIAAERGIVTLAAWLGFIVLAFRGLWPLCRRPEVGAPPETFLRRKIGLGALAALTAFFIAGFFEYNFGDSEIAQLLFVLISLPFAARRLEPEKERHVPAQAS